MADERIKVDFSGIKTSKSLPTGDFRNKLNLFDTDLSVEDKCAARRQYRTLRLTMYAPQSSPYAKNGMSQGHCGYSRNAAKEVVSQYYRTISWLSYLGTK